MITEPAVEEPHEADIVSGLRELSQQVFKDTETMIVNSDQLYAILDKMTIDGKDAIRQELGRVERDGKFSRTRIDDLIISMEEVNLI